MSDIDFCFNNSMEELFLISSMKDVSNFYLYLQEYLESG